MNRARRRRIGQKPLEQAASTNEILGKKKIRRARLFTVIKQTLKGPLTVL
jgi:hypothetical protein